MIVKLAKPQPECGWSGECGDQLGRMPMQSKIIACLPHGFFNERWSERKKKMKEEEKGAHAPTNQRILENEPTHALVLHRQGASRPTSASPYLNKSLMCAPIFIPLGNPPDMFVGPGGNFVIFWEAAEAKPSSPKPFFSLLLRYGWRSCLGCTWCVCGPFCVVLRLDS